MAPTSLRLSGVPGSPYTRKMTALLRYRRIPFELIPSASGRPDLPKAKPRLLPTFYLPDAQGQLQAVTDSTPLIRRFEKEYSGRSVIPLSPALALMDALLEDFADEWLTKAMFHYRWSYAPDIDKASRILATWMGLYPTQAQWVHVAEQIASRQIERLRFVGSNPQTTPVIEAGYLRVLQALELHLSEHPFLLGARPGACDFGFYGQLTQLAQFDPTPMALAVHHAPRVCGWVALNEDLSGLENNESDWFSDDALPPSVMPLLQEVGRLYAPLLLANGTALQASQTQFTAKVDGQTWTQQVFPYQAKCWMWLRRDYEALSTEHRQTVDRWLKGTGCEVLFTPPKYVPI